MILMLFNDAEAIACLEANNYKVKLIWSLLELSNDLNRIIKYGISNPSRSPYYKLNAKPDDGLRLLNSIGSLYEGQFGFRKLLSNIEDD